jgi:hypothetical protein
MNDMTSNRSGTAWRRFYKLSGVAALVAGIIFRRNIAAEISLFSAHTPPTTLTEWFTLLQQNRFLGLAYLNLFDLVNYGLVGMMLLALYVALRHTNTPVMTLATVGGLVGIAVYFASNTAFSMLSLSEQYAMATTDAQRELLLAAGHAMLALNRFSSPGAHPGAGGYVSLLLVASAGMSISVVMLRSAVFSRATAYVGMAASTCDIVYCMAVVFVPTGKSDVLALCFIPAAGLFLTIWHIMIGRRLYQLGRLDDHTRST